MGIFFTLLLAFMAGCSTTEQQISDFVEQMAANDIGSPAWQSSVDGLIMIGRPAARLLVAQLNPDHYVGEHYREFRAEQEKLRTGSARVLGRIKPRGASGALKDRIGPVYSNYERIACIWAIGEIGYDAGSASALKNQLSDTNEIIRLYTSLSLVKMDDESGYGEIIDALKGDDPKLVEIAISGLKESSHFGVPLITRLMTESGPQEKAIEQVAKFVGENLVLQLSSEDPELRRRATTALGLFNNFQFEEPLTRVLSDPSNQVRFSAAAALAGMGSESGINFLFEAIRDIDPILRANAVKFLSGVQSSTGKVGDQLIDALSNADPLSRAGAAQVLGNARVRTAVNALEIATKDPEPSVRTNAIIAIGRIGQEVSRAKLETLTHDENATVAYYARWALRQLNAN